MWEWFSCCFSSECLSVAASSEGLIGAGGSFSKVIHSQASELVLAAGRKPQFIAACLSILLTWWLASFRLTDPRGSKTSKAEAAICFMADQESHSIILAVSYWLCMSALFIFSRDYTRTWMSGTRISIWAVQENSNHSHIKKSNYGLEWLHFFSF